MGKIIGGDAPRLHVLDTTCPATVRAVLEAADPRTTLHLLSSKSGDTVEPNALYAIFRERADRQLGHDAAGLRFVALTDPGSSLVGLALSQGFRATVLTPPAVGGRFSALTAFGLLPAALMGIDIERLITVARDVETSVAAAEADTTLARTIATASRLTLVATPGLRVFGVWLEQLIAESLGKQGKGVVPEIAYAMPQHVRPDQALVVLESAETSPGAAVPAECSARFRLTDPYELGGWFVVWEYATALAGVALGVDPFNQPDVARAKEATAAVLAEEMQPPRAQRSIDGAAITFAGALQEPVAPTATLAAALRVALSALRPDDYVALLAYLPSERIESLEPAVATCAGVLDRAVCLETGPRYLHSTGQLHKGGPNSGVFIVLTTRDAADIAVPGRPWTLAQLYRAQAEGDLTTLAATGRRVMRIDLPDASAGSVDAFAEALIAATQAQ